MRSKHKSFWQSVKQRQDYSFDIFSGTHLSTGVNIAMPFIITSLLHLNTILNTLILTLKFTHRLLHLETNQEVKRSFAGGGNVITQSSLL